jgi:leader peptidase (prepilin peptidase)/N-methyltransferase
LVRETPGANPSGPVIVQNSFRQAVQSLLLVATVAASLAAVPGPDGLAGALLGALMLAIAVTDARRYLIPNELTGAAAALALVRAATIGPDAGASALLWAAARALAIALPLLALMAGYRALRGRDGLGLGDVKLAAVAGAWLGFAALFAAIELAALAAICAYVATAAIKRRPLKSTAFLPFGTFLAPAIWLGWLAEALWG